DDTTLTFVPVQHWPPNKTFTVKLNKEFFSPGVKLSDEKVAFETPEFSAKIAGTQFYIDPKDPSIKKAIITIVFIHPVDAKQIDDRVTFSYSDALIGSSNIKHTVTVDETGMRAYVHSDLIKIQEKEAKLSFVLQSGVSSRDGSGSTKRLNATVNVPGK